MVRHVEAVLEYLHPREQLLVELDHPRAVLNAMRACRSATPATIGTSAPSGPSTSAHSPSAAARVLLPLPLGIATTAVLIAGREHGPHDLPLPLPQPEAGSSALPLRYEQALHEPDRPRRPRLPETGEVERLGRDIGPRTAAPVAYLARRAGHSQLRSRTTKRPQSIRATPPTRCEVLLGPLSFQASGSRRFTQAVAVIRGTSCDLDRHRHLNAAIDLR